MSDLGLPNNSNYVILVSRINLKTNATKINTVFQRCGEIVCSSLRESEDGFGAEALIVFNSAAAVETALQLREVIVDNTALKVDRAPPTLLQQESVDDHATSSPAPLRSNSYISAATAAAVLATDAVDATDAVTRSLSGGQRVVPMSTTFRAIPYDEIKFTSSTPLGHGTFGVVFVAEWRGSKVAVKKLLGFVDVDELAQLRDECALLQRCSNHPNVINFLGACLERGTVYIVTAFCLGGSVHDAFVVRREAFSNAETLRILRDSACGIMHLHKEHVVHRDIAARNFLLDDRRNVFVTDFGMARVKSSVYQHTFSAMGPFKYMAPESIALQRYSERSDAFSFGVYIWALLHRREPYANMEIFAVLSGIVDGSLHLAIEASLVGGEMRVLADLMHECWQTDPLKRPSFDRIMKILT